MMKGIGVSPGIVLGKVLIYKKSKTLIKKKDIKNMDNELMKFEKSINIAANEIQTIYDKTVESVGEKEAEIFNSHKDILEDPEFINDVKEKIIKEKVNVEWAVKESMEYYISLLGKIEDNYLKERALDLKDVCNRLTRILLGEKSIDLKDIDREVILVAKDLTPSDTVSMDKDKIIGIVTELGGKTSHTSIIARTLDIPTVVAVKNITKVIKDKDFIIIDGKEGKAIINPTEEEIKKYENLKEKYNKLKMMTRKMIGKKSISKDGREVEIAGNIGKLSDADLVIENDGDGVGLFRTEFIYMNNKRLPTEEEQFEIYKSIAEKLKGKSVIIRTLDVGGDKEIPYLDLPSELNPFLGYRAIRLCLDKVSIFRTQLRALMRASVFGDIKIMFPMISSVDEIRESKEVLEKVKDELKNENIQFNKNIEVGMMIEIPSTAILSDIFAKEVDFFSIGTNDLIQYTLAVDRGNQNISYLYNQYHPSVLRLIKMTIENGHKEGIWVGMCGEMAGDEKLIPILLSMGLDEFSINPSSILNTRYIISNTSEKKIKNYLDILINLATAKEVEESINSILIETKNRSL